MPTKRMKLRRKTGQDLLGPQSDAQGRHRSPPLTRNGSAAGMSSCPKSTPTLIVGTIGILRSVDRNVLRQSTEARTAADGDCGKDY